MDSVWRTGAAASASKNSSASGFGPTIARTPSGTGVGDVTPFDPMDYARLSPSALDPNNFNNSFVMPRFATNSTASYGGFDVSVVEPDRSRDGRGYGNEYASDSFFHPASFSYSVPTPTATLPAPSPRGGPMLSSDPSAMSYFSNPSPLPPIQKPASSTSGQSGPVYAPYGSSVVSVNPSVPFKLPPIALPASNPPTSPFSPTSLGLPAPPAAGTSTNFAGLYSSSGFDMLSVLARVAARPNPTINIGPVDTSCSFLVVDARKYDFPIVFASETFTRLTGYSSDEIIGKNCRFLQSPNGIQAQGQERKYTDSHAAWHMRQHIAVGKESQSSLINYQKGGKAFINLVTIIPISWDNTDEIAYYVGFQVDLVDQPNAILDRMRDGSYVVNYSLLNQAPKAISMLSVQPEAENEAEPEPAETWEETKPMVGVVEADKDEMSAAEVLDIIESQGTAGLSTEDDKRQFHKLMLDNSDDFVHVLSLKGSILYCSASASKILEYEPSELVGRTIQSVCHPSDIVPVMRELKESGSVQHPFVSLLYRVQRKHSGYIWLEATGKLHIEPGKGRKCVILVGRPRAVFKLNWNQLRQAGGLGETEFWAKLSLEGMVLSSTQGVTNVLGFQPDEMVGTSIYQLIKPESTLDIQQALTAADGGRLMTVQHKLKSRHGLIDVVTRFYPCDAPAALAQAGGKPAFGGVIAQINELSSFERKSSSFFAHQAPELYVGENEPSPLSDDGGSGDGSGKFQSTFKTLVHPSVITQNVFDELDTTRCTSWQYELHQLQIMNKRLRDERDHLCTVTRKRPSDFGIPAPTRKGRAPSESSRASKSSNYGRSCANCGRTDSPEWRAGPTGLRSLCNACGLRWAKAQKDKSGSSGNESSRSPNVSTFPPTPSTSYLGAPIGVSGMVGMGSSDSMSGFDSSRSPTEELGASPMNMWR